MDIFKKFTKEALVSRLRNFRLFLEDKNTGIYQLLLSSTEETKFTSG